jgi:hypothetical protein
MTHSAELTATDFFSRFIRVAHVEVVKDLLTFVDTLYDFQLRRNLFTATLRGRCVLELLCCHCIPTCWNWTGTASVWCFVLCIESKIRHYCS